LSRIGVADRPFCDPSSVVLSGFGGAECAERGSFSVDTDEGGASVVSQILPENLTLQQNRILCKIERHGNVCASIPLAVNQ